MTGWTLALRQPPTLRVDLRGITPLALAGLSALQVAQCPVVQGNQRLPLGEFFSVTARGDEALLLDGDLSRFDRVGWQLGGGDMQVQGAVGDHAGGAMVGGQLRVQGDAGLLAACEMAGGRLEITGNVGDFAAANLPGSLDGMRGGVLIVRGNAGERFADRMRRGTALVFGNAGDFLASRLVAGTVAVGGRVGGNVGGNLGGHVGGNVGGHVGGHVGHGMRRGTVVLVTDTAAPPATFVPAGGDAPVAWQLLARDLARLGGAGSIFAGLQQRKIKRYLGDLAADGKGELVWPQ